MEALCKKEKDAKVLAAPRVVVLDAEEAQMVIGSELAYTAGYTEQPGEEAKPIIKYFLDGMRHNVIGKVLDEDIVRTSVIFTWTDATFSTHKVAKGREIQIPIVSKTESSMVINLPDGAAAYIGGLQSPNEPERSLIMQITAHIVPPGEESSFKDPLPAKEPEGEVTFTVTPQVATSVRFGAPVEQPMPSDTREISQLIQDFAAMLKGEGSATFELLELQATVKEQLGDVRRILDGREFKIANARAEGRYALLVSRPIEADGEEGQLVFNLSKRGDKWVIDDIDFESPGGVKDEMRRFNDRPVKAEPVPTDIDEIGEAHVDLGPMAVEPSGKTVTRIYALQNAKAADIAADLEDLVTGTEHRIVADEASNRIIAVANQRQHQQIEVLIMQLDVAMPGEGGDRLQIQVFELQHANATMLSSRLKDLLTSEQRDVKIIPGPGSSQLTIRANKSNLEQMSKLIAVLDAAPSEAGAVETVTRIFDLKYADAEEVVTILTNLSVLGEDSRIVSNARLNQVIIEATEADLNKIRDVVQQIDVPVDDIAAKKRSIAKDEQLKILIDEREALAEKMQSLRAKIGNIQRELGISEFSKQQDLALQRASSLLAELAKTESLRMQLEAQLSLLEKGQDESVSAQELVKMRQEYVNSDATVKALAEKIAQVEMELLLSRQEKGDTHPEVKSKTELLKALRKRLLEAKDEVLQAFDEQMAAQAEQTRRQNIARIKADIEQNVAYEKKLRARMDEENMKTAEMNQSQLQIQALRDELEAIKAMYDEANRRITDIRMQPDPAPSLYDIVEEKE